MITQNDKQIILEALSARKGGLQRSKAKARNPKFDPIYDEDLRYLAELMMKVQALEVKK